MWNLKNKTNEYNKTNRLRYREQTSDYQRGGGMFKIGEGD